MSDPKKVWLAETRSCDIVNLFIFYLKHSRVRVAGSQILRGRPRNISDPSSSNHHTSGMLTQLRVLASHKWASVAQGALEIFFSKIRSNFFSDTCIFGCIF